MINFNQIYCQTTFLCVKLSLMEKSLILITGLLRNFNKEVASLLSDKLDIYHLDIPDLIEYELADRDNIIEKCGIEYLNKLEKNAVTSALSYENTVLSFDFETFVNYSEICSKNTISFYLCFSKDYVEDKKNMFNTINRIAYIDRDNFLKQKCEYVIFLNKKNKTTAVNEIIKKLKEILL